MSRKQKKDNVLRYLKKDPTDDNDYKTKEIQIKLV